jgi:hypothetical protein
MLSDIIRHADGTLAGLWARDGIWRGVLRMNVYLSKVDMMNLVQFHIGTGGITTRAFEPYHHPLGSQLFFGPAPETLVRTAGYHAPTVDALEEQTRQLAETLLAAGWPQWIALCILALFPLFVNRCRELDLLGMPEMMDAFWNQSLQEYSTRLRDRFVQGGKWGRLTSALTLTWHAQSIAEVNLNSHLGLPDLTALPFPVPTEFMSASILNAEQSLRIENLKAGILATLENTTAPLVASVPVPSTSGFVSQFATATGGRAAATAITPVSVTIHFHKHSPLSPQSLQGQLVCKHYLQSLLSGNGHCPLGNTCPHRHVSRCLRQGCPKAGKPAAGATRVVESTCGALHEWEILLYS